MAPEEGGREGAAVRCEAEVAEAAPAAAEEEGAKGGGPPLESDRLVIRLSDPNAVAPAPAPPRKAAAEAPPLPPCSDVLCSCVRWGGGAIPEKQRPPPPPLAEATDALATPPTLPAAAAEAFGAPTPSNSRR